MQGSGEVYYPRLLAALQCGHPTISHCHAPAGPDVAALLKHLPIQPVVLYRRLPDVIVSRRDMLLKDGWARELLSPDARKRFLGAEPASQLDITIDLFAAQYINFVVGWREMAKVLKSPSVFARYEDMVADELRFAGDIVRRLGLRFAAENWKDVSKELARRGGINRNKGVSGRGRRLLSETQLRRLSTLGAAMGCQDQDFLLGATNGE